MWCWHCTRRGAGCLRMVGCFRWQFVYGGLPRSPHPAAGGLTPPEPPELGAPHAREDHSRASRCHCEPRGGVRGGCYGVKGWEIV
jgi:hypothetical protein